MKIEKGMIGFPVLSSRLIYSSDNCSTITDMVRKNILSREKGSDKKSNTSKMT